MEISLQPAIKTLGEVSVTVQIILPHMKHDVEDSNNTEDFKLFCPISCNEKTR